MYYKLYENQRGILKKYLVWIFKFLRAYMETFAKSDIFFIIASAGFVILTVLMSILLVYAIRSARNISQASEKLKGTASQVNSFIKTILAFFTPKRKKVHKPNEKK